MTHPLTVESEASLANAATQDDALLLAFATMRDEAAFRLVERHTAWMYAAAFRQLGDAHAAEDAIQAAFILLTQRAGRLTGKVKVSGWLFRTVGYCVRSIQRAQRRRRMHELKAFLERSEVAAVEPPLAKELDGAAARLGPEDQLAIVLRFYRGLEFPEVARELGVTPDAARQRVSRAVGRLRGKFAGATLASVAAASAFGKLASGATLHVQLSQVALNTASGAEVSAGTAVAMKGAVYFMAMGKLKVAAGAVVVVLLAGAVTATGMMLMQSGKVPVETVPAAVGKPIVPAAASAPATGVAQTHVLTTFEKVYAVTAEEGMRVVRRPYIPERLEFYRNMTDKLQVDAIPQGSDTMIVQWQDGTPKLLEQTYGRNGYRIADLAAHFLGYSTSDVEGTLATKTIPGDIVMVDHMTKPQLIAAIEKIGSEAFGMKVTLTQAEVERPVVVLKGAWKYTGVGDNVGGWNPRVELYGANLNGDKRVDPTRNGTIKELEKDLSEYINKPVDIEATGVPEKIEWHRNQMGDGTRASAKQSHDPELVLQHVVEQTGLTRSEEKRKMRRLIVSEGGNGAAGAMP